VRGEDTWSRTEADAGRAEFWRSIDDYDDTPTASDLAADAELDAFEARLREHDEANAA
jgi:hypothetical protein